MPFQYRRLSFSGSRRGIFRAIDREPENAERAISFTEAIARAVRLVKLRRPPLRELFDAAYLDIPQTLFDALPYAGNLAQARGERFASFSAIDRIFDIVLP